MMLLVLLSFLGLTTLWLTSYRRRCLARWHLQWLMALSYQDFLDVLLSLFQFVVIILVLFFYSATINLGEVLTFLTQTSWHWQILCYLVLYLMAIIEMTLLVLILIFDVLLQKDSRLLFKKITWLPFRQDKPVLSILLLGIVILVDSLFYLGLLILLGEQSLTSLATLILGYGIVKACRYSGWLNVLLAFCLFTIVGLWAVTATLLYGWLVGVMILTVTYLMISCKEY
ncbi:SagF family protein [Streptococcus pyogenes]|uniref:SagF family protein n=1 Tax=Streptococcus pyogenes TaxID=1314 RepID=UPI0007C29FF4|nr:SagF family protein [Streptococcus pyogenes]OAC81712.1 streptolysin associated protein SagF [Streptococcus pyogenes]OAC84104.1 streptolysin associated protein SagF [Streptococcus pyogenes]OAC84806.1 streptolysin associated protein SagF [Streptococcus pyogenes]OAC88340.1 streptolysin associated protein SagF [Streptococcus pyogenes]PWV35085.1 streptolysin associated protein SagF [Streptococcus pyogenes]